jgi:hypothetical protein
MKKISLLIIGFAMSVASFAAPASSLVISAKNETVFNVHYQTSQAGTVRISIVNNDNQTVFAEVLTNIGSFVRPYNFSELEEGEYTIVVESKNGKQAEKINYATAKIISFAMVTEVENQKNKYLLNVNNNGAQNVTVRIIAEDGTLLHERTMEVIGSAGVVYDLNQVKKDNSAITFEISVNGNSVQTIHI